MQKASFFKGDCVLLNKKGKPYVWFDVMVCGTYVYLMSSLFLIGHANQVVYDMDLILE